MTQNRRSFRPACGREERRFGALKCADGHVDAHDVYDRSDQERIGEPFASILGAAQEGAEWAVTVLYRSLQPRLLRFLRAQAAQDADDVASQTWLEVATGLSRFQGSEDEFRALVFTVARRRLFDLRRAARRRPVVLDGGETLHSVPGTSTAEDVALGLVGGDEAARRIVELLPREQAEIVLLRVVAGLSADEVAAITGRRAGTVRVLQHRALRRLAEQLGDELASHERSRA